MTITFYVFIIFVDKLVNERIIMPRRKEDFAKQSEERIQTIYKAALPLFSLKGYDSVSIDDIAKSAKCSHGLFYHYFSSKQDLFEKMMGLIKKKWEAGLKDLNMEQKPMFALRDITRFYFSHLTKEDEDAYILYLFLTFNLQKKLPKPKTKPTKEQLKSKPFFRIHEVISEGQQEGIFIQCDTHDLTKLYFSALEGLAYNRIHLGKKKFKVPDQNVLINMFIKKEDSR